ncbi:uncharacterized protein LOC143010049 [Genypterus blacodes]|uniref:uncharacterized protein LOC143010049 n=1 Tax=Genypterus blacodes TaxID=154954 RepID=UPI003F7775B1
MRLPLDILVVSVNTLSDDIMSYSLDPLGIDEEKHKNWLRSVYGLKCLKNYLDPFADREAEFFHRVLRRTLKLGPKECANNCSFAQWKPTPNQKPSINCEVCTPWRDIIWDHIKCQKGSVFWVNSEPCLWFKDKWEVAKVYMPRGHKKHKLVREFDIPALLGFMSNCQHFEEYDLKSFCDKVVNARNEVMHSPDYELEQEELNDYLNRIKDLGEKLKEDFKEFCKLSKDIDEIRNRDFTLESPMSREAAMGGSDECGTMKLLNDLRGFMTDEEIESFIFAAVQKSRVGDTNPASLRRESPPQPQHQDDVWHGAAAAADTEETADHTMDYLMMNKTRLMRRIDEVRDPSGNMHQRAEEAHHSQQSPSRELALPQTKQKTSKAEDCLIDFFAKTYAVGESLCKALDSDEEEEEKNKPVFRKLSNMYSFIAASAMTAAKNMSEHAPK